MRLPSKKEVILAKAKERQVEIEEGVRLAQKVDALRKAKVTEEGNLNRFRDGSFKVLHDELIALTERKKNLLEEIDAATQELEKARFPLDAEWDAVRESQASIEKQQSVLSEERLELDRAKEDLVIRETGIAAKEIEVSNRLEETKKYEIDAAALFGEAKNDRASAESLFKSALDVIEEREEGVLKKEKATSQKELELAIFEENLKLRDSSLSDRERQVNDRYQTLLRAEKEIKHGKRK